MPLKDRTAVTESSIDAPGGYFLFLSLLAGFALESLP